MIDLKPFCSTDPYREYLHAPWSRDDWTYATNGHVLIRIPRTDAADNEKAPNAGKLFDQYPLPVDMRPMPTFELPVATSIECAKCDGSGKEHDCPDCNCECEECGGSGESWEKVSVGIGDVSFAARYMRLIAALPGAAVPKAPIARAPMPYTFAGGSGLLMPLNSKYHVHIEEPVNVN